MYMEQARKNIEEVFYDEEIYPRQQHNLKTVEHYIESLKAGNKFPAIELQKIQYDGEVKDVLIDGWHRLNAHLEIVKQPDLFINTDAFKAIDSFYWKPDEVIPSSDKVKMLELKLHAASANTRHGDRLEEQDKKSLAREIAEAILKDEITQQEVADSLGVRRQRISEWIADIRARQTAGRDCLIKKLHLLGWTQDEIGRKVGIAQRTVSNILSSFADFGKTAKELQTFLTQGKSMEWIAEHYSIDLQLAWAIRLWEKSDEERAEGLGIDIKKYNLWNYTNAHELMGLPTFTGRIPGQIPFNIIHWFSKQGDLIIDPMAGSGTTLDAALLLNRKCRAFDMNPKRNDIEEADTTKEIPYDKLADLIFVNPPYWKTVDYGKGLSACNLDAFGEGITALAQNCHNRLREKGFFALIMGNQSTKIDEVQQPTLNLIDGVKQRVLDVGFKWHIDIMCPWPTQGAENWAQAKWEKGYLADLKREIMVLKK